MIKNHEERLTRARFCGNLSKLERRRTVLYTLAGLFSSIGLADSIYLTIQHVTDRVYAVR